ncbi:MAG: MMPL family transporter [Actinomycetota bacterium]
MRLNTESLARASARRPWITIATWVVLLLSAGFITSRLLGGVLTTEFDFTNEPESVRANQLLERVRGPEKLVELFIVRSRDLTVEDRAFEARVREVQRDVAGIDGGVEQVVTYYDTQDPTLVSQDGHATLVNAVMAGSLDEAAEFADELRAVADEHTGEGAEVLVAGPVTINDDFSAIAEEDLRTGESIGIVAALIVLLVVFGAVVAAVVPILLAVVAIVVAVGAVALLGQAFDFSYFVTNMITMMGLAVGIDYSLFIVSRYREERGRGHDKLEAIRLSGATASRAVFFSGMTVVLALVGMLLVPTTIFRSLALGAILVVLFAILASMTLLPAVLSLLGDRVNAIRVLRRRRPVEAGERRGGFWDQVTRRVMRRPVTSLVLASGLLIAAGVSYFGIETGFGGVSTLPNDIQSKRAFNILATEFAGGITSPVAVVVDGDPDGVQAAVEDLQRALAQDDGFGPSLVETGAGLTVVSAAPVGDPSGKQAVASVERLRESIVPEAFAGVDADVLVGGETAQFADFFDVTDRYTPIVFVFVLGLSFLLLTVVFRSIVVPIKAIIMNLLSVGAAYGLLVLVFQEGVGADLLGFQQVEAIEAWLPLFLFAVLFGLSMDYHVFLLTRIRERFDQTGDNGESVAFGLRTTAGIITGAALIMVAVFAGFAAGKLVMFQQMGFGLAVAVFLDATIVRSVLVPATMKLLGDRNWYLPGWLRWLPDLKVEGIHAREAAATRDLERPRAPVGA